MGSPVRNVFCPGSHCIASDCALLGRRVVTVISMTRLNKWVSETTKKVPSFRSQSFVEPLAENEPTRRAHTAMIRQCACIMIRLTPLLLTLLDFHHVFQGVQEVILRCGRRTRRI